MPTTITENVKMTGTLNVETLVANNSIDNDDLASNAAIAATKLEHQFGVSVELYAEGTEIVALASKTIHIVQGATGEIVSVEAAIFTQATGADRTVDVALQKSTGAAAFVTVMSANVSIDNTTVVRTATAGTLDSTKTDLVDGDILRLVVTVAGSAGNQAEGLVVTVFIREDPE